MANKNNRKNTTSLCTQYHGKPIKCNASTEDGVECVYTAGKVKGDIGLCRKSISEDHEIAKERARRRDTLEKNFQKDALDRYKKARERKSRFSKVVDDVLSARPTPRNPDSLNKERLSLIEEKKEYEREKLRYMALSEETRNSQNLFREANIRLKKQLAESYLTHECWFKTPGKKDGRGNPDCGYSASGKCNWNSNIKRCKPDTINPTLGIKQLYRHLQYINTQIEILDDKKSQWSGVKIDTGFNILLGIVGEAVNYWEDLIHQITGKKRKSENNSLHNVDKDIRNIVETQDKIDIIKSELLGSGAVKYVNSVANKNTDSRILDDSNDNNIEGVLGKSNNMLVEGLIENMVHRNSDMDIPALKLLILKTAYKISLNDNQKSSKIIRNRLVRFYNIICRGYKECNDPMSLEEIKKYKSDGECVLNNKNVRRTKETCSRVKDYGCSWDGYQCRLEK